MAARRTQLDGFKKVLLNRITTNSNLTEYIESCLAREEEAIKYSFHKVIVPNWSGTDVHLFEVISNCYKCSFIPIMYHCHEEVASFYTSSLVLILKIIKRDLIFLYQKNMYTINILFNEKNSSECFDNIASIEDIISGVVSRRMNDKNELDLSNFCSDPEITEKRIIFYKINLLSQFKILMLRIGRETKSLNLSKNNLSQVPIDVLNFFIKGDLTAIDLSHNNIPSISDVRVSSKIEKLWLEGNPLCDELEPLEYVKNATIKFPRLTELDGISINQHGCIMPHFKNYLVTPDRKTKLLVEKFLTLYFTYYDSDRDKINTFYHDNATFTFSADLTEDETTNVYGMHCRNVLNPTQRAFVYGNRRIYEKEALSHVLRSLPPTEHDPSTFNIDVLHHDNKMMIIVVDGIFREQLNVKTLRQFRRTFVFKIDQCKPNSLYCIINDMLNIANATPELVKNCFKYPLRNRNELALLNPEPEESAAVIKVFMHLTQLKKPEVEQRLKVENWDIRKALEKFMNDLRCNWLSQDRFIDDDDFSDSSSLLSCEIDE